MLNSLFMLDLPSIRRQFPILAEQVDGHLLVYLDSAATAQKPSVVLDALVRFYEHGNANAHRGMHVLAERATVAYEGARETVRRFVGARRKEEIVFVKSCTEAINLAAIAASRGKLLGKGDRVVLSVLEHHSNIVPWLQLQEREGIEILWMDCDDQGRLRLEQLDGYLQKERVKLVSITGQSNVLGVRPPLREITSMAHGAGALVLVDAAQSIAHGPTDVAALDCDFLAFSGHKLYGPMGIGVLYGKLDLLRALPPFLGGGMMIETVAQDGFTPAEIPARFEAGTQPVADAVGLGGAIDWLSRFPWKDIVAHDAELMRRTLEALATVPGLRILGPGNAGEAAGCVSFTVEGVHPHDLTEILGRRGFCLRAGHHCAQPLHRRLGIAASSRVSFGIYNTLEEIDLLPREIEQAVSMLRRS